MEPLEDLTIAIGRDNNNGQITDTEGNNDNDNGSTTSSFGTSEDVDPLDQMNEIGTTSGSSAGSSGSSISNTSNNNDNDDDEEGGNNNNNNNNNNDDDDDLTVIILEQGAENVYMNQTSNTNTGGGWMEQDTPEMEERRRNVLLRELQRVQRASFIHFLILCLIPTSLLFIVIATVVGEDEECESAATICHREQRTFINAFTTRCICEAITLVKQQQP